MDKEEYQMEMKKTAPWCSFFIRGSKGDQSDSFMAFAFRSVIQRENGT